MVIIAYILSIISFYISYMLITLILGMLGMQIRRFIYKILLPEKEVRLSGSLLTMVTYCSTIIGFFTSLPIFMWIIGTEPNWYILTPIFIYMWMKFTPALYSPFYNEGSAQIGMISGVISWFVILFKIHNQL